MIISTQKEEFVLKRKRLAIMLWAFMVMTMAAGCRGNFPYNSTGRVG